MSECAIGSEGVEAIVSSLRFARLETLMVRRCSIDDSGALSIAKASSKLKTVDARENGITEKGCSVLRAAYGDRVLLSPIRRVSAR